jgi:hypothetical protein
LGKAALAAVTASISRRDIVGERHPCSAGNCRTLEDTVEEIVADGTAQPITAGAPISTKTRDGIPSGTPRAAVSTNTAGATGAQAAGTAGTTGGVVAVEEDRTASERDLAQVEERASSAGAPGAARSTRPANTAAAQSGSLTDVVAAAAAYTHIAKASRASIASSSLVANERVAGEE